eukprot:gene3996-5463_t
MIEASYLFSTPAERIDVLIHPQSVIHSMVEYEDGSTLAQLGPLGGIATTPVINRPEVAIIGPNKIVERPVFHGDDIVRAKLMNLSISCDHRVVDGWDAANYVQALKKYLETPAHHARRRTRTMTHSRHQSDGAVRHIGELAEREGFEPSIRFWRILTFQASAFDHSATAPHVLDGSVALERVSVTRKHRAIA